MTPERLFLDQLGVIDQVVQFIARRHHLHADEADDLASAVKLKLIENDYEALRNFRGRSSLKTYLTTIALRHYLDTRIAQWGKWRPCMQARRLGPTAMLLDRLISRDGMSLDEAVDTARSNHGIAAPRDELLALGASLPIRVRRRFSDPQELESVAAPPSPQEAAGVLDARTQAERIEQALADSLDRLADEDRLILKMKFQDGLQVSRIARTLGLDQKSLYRRLGHVIRTLREALEASGVSRDQVEAIVGHPEADLSGTIGGPPRKSGPERPSI